MRHRTLIREKGAAAKTFDAQMTQVEKAILRNEQAIIRKEQTISKALSSGNAAAVLFSAQEKAVLAALSVEYKTFEKDIDKGMTDKMLAKTGEYCIADACWPCSAACKGCTGCGSACANNGCCWGAKPQ